MNPGAVDAYEGLPCKCLAACNVYDDWVEAGTPNDPDCPYDLSPLSPQQVCVRDSDGSGKEGKWDQMCYYHDADIQFVLPLRIFEDATEYK
jgi:hypothetical protein